MQAQVPHNPYLGLWSRVAGFDPGELSTLLTERAVVRIVVMRGTVHLVTADDALVLRPLSQPVLDGEMRRHSQYAATLAAIDVDEVVDFARPLLDERPRGARELRRLLAARFEGIDPGALVLACRNRLALVQVPPRGLWRRSGEVTTATIESWLGRPVDPAPSIDEVMLRYLDAYGPAQPADMAAWSRLTGLRDVVERVRPRLRTFRDDRGRELLDVADGILVDGDAPAAPRFLPEYDNALLAHADRSRFQREDAPLLATQEPVHGTVLEDGQVCATWALGRVDGTSTMTVRHLPVPKRRLAAVVAEGDRALRFIEPDATTHRVVLVPAAG